MSEIEDTDEEETLKPLSTKQRAFVLHYLKTWNATLSAKEAGYNAKASRAAGHSLLKRPNIRHAIKEARDAHFDNLGVSTEKILGEMAKVAFTDIDRFLEFGPKGVKLKDGVTEIPPSAMACVKSIREIAHVGTNGKVTRTIDFKLHDKMKALEMLARTQSMFQDGVNHKHEISWTDLVRKAAEEDAAKGK